MKLFVWDFHGTLEQGNDLAVIEITNRVLEQHGWPNRLSIKEAETLAGKRWYEYFAYLLPDLKLSDWLNLQTSCLDLFHAGRALVAKYIKLNEHVMEVLERISQSPHMQIVISNTQPHALDFFLEIVGIEHYFASGHRIGVDGSSSISKTKKEWLIEFLKGKEFESIITVGDSPTDVALADCHPQGIGYLYSYPTRPHREANCHYKITSLLDVLREL